MKILISTFIAVLAFTGCSCYAGSVKPKEEQQNVVKGEYLVLAPKVKINTVVIIKDALEELAPCTVKKLPFDIVQVTFEPKVDPGLEAVQNKLKPYQWIKSVEPNRIAKISG